MKKRAVLTIMFSILMLPLSAGIFSGYDFTYFKSVAPSTLHVMDYSRLGIDYTGYGYLGDMTSGIYLRLGLQTPYTTIMKLFEDRGGDAQEPEMLSGENGQSAYEFKVLFSMGPAFRRFVDTTLSWYMGTGVMVEQDRTIIPGDAKGRRNQDTETRNTVAFDIDFGFRLSAAEHSVMRIGAYFSRPLFVLTETRSGDEEPEFQFEQKIFTPLDGEQPFKMSGYISLGHTYMSGMYKDTYTYTMESPEFGTGRLEKD